MCGEVVAAPLSLQDTVYPILRKKSLHFCENSRKFLKLCTAVRKKYKMKRLRRKTNPLSLAALASSPKGAPFEVEVKFLITSETSATELTACALSVKPYRACQLSQRESQEHCRKLSHFT